MKTFHGGKVELHSGNCPNILCGLDSDSVDAVVTDPPYGLRFMSREWDAAENIAFTPELWAEVLRVLKPGGHMVAFSGTRTYHRMAVAIEDAGFEIRDQLAWVYGSGFPKSHDVSKGIDRAAKAEREIVGSYAVTREFKGRDYVGEASHATEVDITAPATDAARQWQGYGTALKPAWEPICLARKPLSEGTVAANVLRWGTGALNIDACRVASDAADPNQRNSSVAYQNGIPLPTGNSKGRPIANLSTLGRWPANLCHDGSPEVLTGFPESKDGVAVQRNGGGQRIGYSGSVGDIIRRDVGYGSGGYAARFFYTAKADADDRLRSKHPTVKPVDLMQWLVRMVCPKGGTVLDPFAGTGTTGAATFIEGCRAVLIEREAEYLADIERRMELLLSGPDERSRKLTVPEPYESLPLFGAL